ncbi:MAG: hypothetical protein K0Q81_1922, partial [Paenibacillus sp.]|nr:hypothetical protein [Paenibacillus sp.]
CRFCHETCSFWYIRKKPLNPNCVGCLAAFSVEKRMEQILFNNNHLNVLYTYSQFRIEGEHLGRYLVYEESIMAYRNDSSWKMD